MQDIIARAKANKQRIVLPEGTEERTLKAADRLVADGVADIILIGNPDEIHKLAELPITCAFIPMDPRLEQHQFRGIEYVLKNTSAQHVFPMHMWQDYSGIEEYKKRVSNLGMAERVMDISGENQVFTFNEN